MKLPSGLYAGLHEADYLQLEAASASALGTIHNRSPAHMQWDRDHPRAETAATRTGSAIHTAVLEPDAFHLRYVVAEECTAQVASGPRKGDPCGATASILAPDGRWLCGVHGRGIDSVQDGRLILTADEYALAFAAADAVWKHPAARKALHVPDSDREVTAIWTDPEYGVLCKARFDVVNDGLQSIVDIKSTFDASPGQFLRTVRNFGYHRKAGWYLHGAAEVGLTHNRFRIVAVETTQPVCVAVYDLDDATIMSGWRQCRRALARYAECLQSRRWDGYGDDVMTIGLRDWEHEEPLEQEHAWPI